MDNDAICKILVIFFLQSLLDANTEKKVQAMIVYSDRPFEGSRALLMSAKLFELSGITF